MGLSELIVIFFVAIILVKPDDLPILAKKINKLRSYFKQTKEEILSHMDISEDAEIFDQDHDSINYYLEKIANHGETYDGEYDLDKIKARFDSIVTRKIESSSSEKGWSK